MTVRKIPDLWPPDITVCPRCGNDMLQTRHTLDGMGVVRCPGEPELDDTSKTK